MEKGSYRGFHLSLCSPCTTQGRLLPEVMSCCCNSVLPFPLFTSKPSPGNLPLYTISLQFQKKKKRFDFCNSEHAPVLRRCALCTSWSISDHVGILSFTLSHTPHVIPVHWNSPQSFLFPLVLCIEVSAISYFLWRKSLHFCLSSYWLLLDSFPRKGRNGNFMPHLQTRGPYIKFLPGWSLVSCSFQP